MWAVRSVRLRSDENTTQSRRSLKTGKSWGGLEAKRRRKDEEKTERRLREGAERVLTQ
ncbi:hypothetical protein [Crocosphaera sp. Alani8]|uniref:hypothetical protein n=1 Tax=Crocosphaera sp. Alani8 TaxID=3038952 RepID=UPI00313DD8FC